MKASKRNRHTGHINAFKLAIIQRCKATVVNGRVYHRALVGKGFTIVRTK